MGKKPTGPKYIQLYTNPILDVLRELGGSGNSREVIDLVVQKLNIPEKELEEKIKSGVSRVENQIAWTRMYLVKAGFLDSSKRGVWTLTDKGLKTKLTSDEIFHMFKTIHSSYLENSKHDKEEKQTDKTLQKIEQSIEEENDLNDNYKIELLSILKKLPPYGFERICQRLLRESGFQQVKVTSKSNDGGIDGHGILEINPLVSFKVIFQCKRYEGSVGSSQVRDFRGAMMGRAGKGIILTTGKFTLEAKKESVRDGVPPIELVDGEKLTAMFEKLELGLKPKMVYEIDNEFFQDYFES